MLSLSHIMSSYLCITTGRWFCFMPLFKYHIRKELQRYTNAGFYICLCSYLYWCYLFLDADLLLYIVHSFKIDSLRHFLGGKFTIKEHSQSLLIWECLNFSFIFLEDYYQMRNSQLNNILFQNFEGAILLPSETVWYDEKSLLFFWKSLLCLLYCCFVFLFEQFHNDVSHCESVWIYPIWTS